MKQVEMRRINPVGHVVSLVVGIIVLFEVFVIVGAVDLKAETVRRYVPWAYDAFVRGEQQLEQWADVALDEAQPTEAAVSTDAWVPDEPNIPPVSATNGVIELEPIEASEVEPVEINAPDTTIEDDVPVG